MNKAKLIALSFLSLVLVACSNNDTASTQPANESVSESSVESQLESSETKEESKESQESQSQASESEDEADETSNDETPAAEDAIFRFYVGEEEIAHFTAKDVAGKSILEVLESQDKVSFTFDEEEGVISEVEGHEIDPSEAIYWTYLLDKQFAELGVVSQVLEGGELIEWYFGTIDDIPTAIIQEDGTYTEEEPVDEEDTEEVDNTDEDEVADQEEADADAEVEDTEE